MNVKSVEKHDDKSTATVILEVDKDTFQNALDRAYRKVKNTITLPGFRKGKAPRRIVEGMYGKNVFYEDGINILFPEIWPDAVEKAEITVVGEPSISDLNDEEDGSLTLTVEAGLYPVVTLGQYKGLEAEKETPEVTDEEVDQEIQKLADRNARIQTVDRAAENGDTVVIDYKGYLDGEEFEGGSAENYNLTLGSGTFIPGFEDQLVGVKAGDEKDVNVTFPEDYTEKSLAGKPVTFKVKVHEVKETLKPELDDEFAKDVSETADTFEDLKKEIHDRLQSEKSESADTKFKNAVMQAAIDNMETVIPDAMVDAEVDSIMQQYEANMRQSGFTLQSYAGMLGTTVDQLRQEARPGALSRLKGDLLLEKVAEVENLDATDDEIEEEYKKIANENGMTLDKVKEYVPKEQMASDLKFRKAYELITDSAVAKEPAPKAEKAEEKVEAEEKEKEKDTTAENE